MLHPPAHQSSRQTSRAGGGAGGEGGVCGEGEGHSHGSARGEARERGLAAGRLAAGRLAAGSRAAAAVPTVVGRGAVPMRQPVAPPTTPPRRPACPHPRLRLPGRPTAMDASPASMEASPAAIDASPASESPTLWQRATSPAGGSMGLVTAAARHGLPAGSLKRQVRQRAMYLLDHLVRGLLLVSTNLAVRARALAGCGPRRASRRTPQGGRMR